MLSDMKVDDVVGNLYVTTSGDTGSKIFGYFWQSEKLAELYSVGSGYSDA